MVWGFTRRTACELLEENIKKCMEPTKELGMEEFTREFALPGQILRCEVLARSWGHREGGWVCRDSLGQTVIVKCQFKSDKMVNFSSGFCYHPTSLTLTASS